MAELRTFLAIKHMHDNMRATHMTPEATRECLCLGALVKKMRVLLKLPTWEFVAQTRHVMRACARLSRSARLGEELMHVLRREFACSENELPDHLSTNVRRPLASHRDENTRTALVAQATVAVGPLSALALGSSDTGAATQSGRAFANQPLVVTPAPFALTQAAAHSRGEETPREICAGVAKDHLKPNLARVVLDLDHTVVHVKRRNSPSEMHTRDRLSMVPVEFEFQVQTQNRGLWKVFVRRGTAKFISALRAAGVEFCVATMNLEGRRIVEHLAKICPEAWKGIPVTIFEARFDGAKSLTSLESAHARFARAGRAGGTRILDDNPRAWAKMDRPLVIKVKPFDVDQPPAPREATYLKRILADLRCGFALPAYRLPSAVRPAVTLPSALESRAATTPATPRSGHRRTAFL